MGSPDPWLSQQFIKKSTESVTTFRKKHFVHIYFTYLQCKINYRLQRNPVIFLANQNILKALVVSEGHVSQLSLLTFRSSSLLCLCVNFKKFAITSHADRFCPGLHRGQKYMTEARVLQNPLFCPGRGCRGMRPFHILGWKHRNPQREHDTARRGCIVLQHSFVISQMNPADAPHKYLRGRSTELLDMGCF